MTGTEKDSFIRGDTLTHKLSQGLKIVFGETGIGKPVVEAEG
jgi:DNA repair ATPase RecN